MTYWNDTITLYSKYTENINGKDVTKFRRNTVGDVFCKINNKQLNSDRALHNSNKSIIRVPSHKGIMLNVGDIVVLGTVDDFIDEYSKSKRSSDLLSKYNKASFIVNTVHCNTRFQSTSHIYGSDE